LITAMTYRLAQSRKTFVFRLGNPRGFRFRFLKGNRLVANLSAPDTSGHRLQHVQMTNAVTRGQADCSAARSASSFRMKALLALSLSLFALPAMA